jgi:carbonic anhydrase
MNRSSKLVAIVCGAIALFLTLPALANDKTPSVSPEAALAKLQAGNDRFAANSESSTKPTTARRLETATAQHPFAVILGCADSRIPPELIFDQNIGDLFVIRSAGNLVDEHTLGSIEYAVEHLGVRLVVVLGHARCGAVKAALGSDKAPGHINSLVHDIQPAVAAAKAKPGDAVVNTVHQNASIMAERIRKEADLGELRAKIRIVDAYYDLDTGKVEWPTAATAHEEGSSHQ